MTDDKPTRRELLRPLHLLGIALGCGVFAAVVTLVSTGAFTTRVIDAVARGAYDGLTPWGLALVIGGSAFIITLLILAMLILAVDPAQVTKTVDRPVLLDPPAEGAPAEDAAAEETPETGADESAGAAQREAATDEDPPADR
ncbi:hypothetical protein [Microbacterium resistens]|uniref:hypothetical protein n=1 Tax=Microbacterium resistens TaxID=156977 RepID=UPI0027E37A57|nr:hypothetical protein [Microbacterium resistens]